MQQPYSPSVAINSHVKERFGVGDFFNEKRVKEAYGFVCGLAVERLKKKVSVGLLLVGN